jgi:hypothetical protein
MIAIVIAWLLMIPVAIAMFVAWDLPGMAEEGLQPMEMLIGGVAVGSCALLVWVAYPACVLYFMTRPQVKQAFIAPPSGQEPPYASPYQPPWPQQ